MPTLIEILESDQTNTERVVSDLKKALEDYSPLEAYSLRELSTLRFSLSDLNPSALVHLLKALENNKTITNLVWFSELSNEAVDTLITTLQKNQH